MAKSKALSKVPSTEVSGIRPQAAAALFDDLGLKGNEVRAALLHDLTMSLSFYVTERQGEVQRGSGLGEIKSAQRAHDAIAEVLLALRELGPSVSRSVFHDWGDELPETLTSMFEDFSSTLLSFVSDGCVARGRPSLEILDLTIVDLKRLYRKYTGKVPRYSSAYASKPTSKSRATHGPFMRFCEGAIGLVDPPSVGAVRSSIRRVLSR